MDRQIYTHEHMHACMCTHTRAHTRASAHTHTLTHALTHERTHARERMQCKTCTSEVKMACFLEHGICLIFDVYVGASTCQFACEKYTHTVQKMKAISSLMLNIAGQHGRLVHRS